MMKMNERHWQSAGHSRLWSLAFIIALAWLPGALIARFYRAAMHKDELSRRE